MEEVCEDSILWHMSHKEFPLRLVVREGVLYHCAGKFLQVVGLQDSVIVEFSSSDSRKIEFSFAVKLWCLLQKVLVS